MLITDENRLIEFHAQNRLWQGIPGIERTKGGRLFSTFYSGGTAEQLGNYCVLLQSDDDGITWSEPIAGSYLDENHRCYDPCLWIDPLHRLWFIWSGMPNNTVWAAICDEPDEKTLKWSEPIKIGNDVMMNKPIVLSTGEWLLPIAVWNNGISAVGKHTSKGTQRLSFVYITKDNGRNFKKIGGADVPKRSFDEHQLLELKDGSLLMLVRTIYGIGKSYSYDGGYTWTPGVDSGIKGPCSRFFIRRLSSGNVLLVNHYNFQGRNNLTAMISKDDCKTWSGYLLLDERSNVSYPDAVEGNNGFIYITYDRERGANLHDMTSVMKSAREILMARVTERDILAGKIVDKNSQLKCIINKLGEYCGSNQNPFGEFNRYSLDEYVDTLMNFSDENRIIDEIFTHYGNCCINLKESNQKVLDDSIEKILNKRFDTDIHIKRFTIGKVINILKSASENNDTDITNYLFDRIFQYINLNVSQDLSLDVMAEKLQISKFYMCHIFKTKTNTTIVQYKNSRRVAIAKKLLANTDLSILEICMKVGFGDSSYFSKWFKKEEGITPKKYREWNKLR